MTTTARNRRTRHQPAGAHPRGSIAVELVMILVPFMLALAAIFELGRAFWYYDALAKSTRNAARFLSSAPVDKFASQSIPGAVALAVNASQAAGMSPALTSGNVTVTCMNDAFRTQTCRDGTAPPIVAVTINYSFTLGGILPLFYPTSKSTPVVATFTPGTTMRYLAQ